ncbi:hypothetical protein CFAM422_012205 [Trichoderma lentiforme]|uniref:Uncharacterized protein n=1 Tax=Trichoderma lentiforme TaxID=1567552 RepID=A0A9P4X482_9HYPO|nr:hypothetical protein CFAM422_012205 [Trichoderma lentiforme]
MATFSVREKRKQGLGETLNRLAGCAQQMMNHATKEVLVCAAVDRKGTIKKMMHNYGKSADVSVKIAFVEAE